MAKRSQPRYSVPVVEQPVLTPDAKIGFTVKQALVAVGIIASAVAGFGALKWDNMETRNDVAAIKKTQEAFTAQTPAALRDQDEKRSKLGEQFLASNREIASKVGELATAVAVQQADARATKDALVRISDQLNVLVRQMPAPSPARGR